MVWRLRRRPTTRPACCGPCRDTYLHAGHETCTVNGVGTVTTGQHVLPCMRQALAMPDTKGRTAMSFPVQFKGRLGAEPEITFAPNGTAVGKMRIVTNGRRIVEGTWEDTDTSWWNVTAFGRVAEAVADTVHKGDLVMVAGKVKQRDWEKDGVKRTTADIVADEVALVIKANIKAAAPDQGAGWANDDKAPF